MKKIIISCIVVIIILGTILGIGIYNNQQKQKMFDMKNNILTTATESYYEYMEDLYRTDDYENIWSWYVDLVNLKQRHQNIGQQAIESYQDFLSEEDIEILKDIDIQIQKSVSMTEINNYVFTLESITVKAIEAKEAAEAEQRQQELAARYAENASGFKSAGVIYDNGYRYTYYSSRVLYHYRTGEWTAGADGIYRDADGYIIVASDDDPFGSIVPTPFGAGIVLDTGAGSGTRDIYVNW